jgi:hypothetical protein
MCWVYGTVLAICAELWQTEPPSLVRRYITDKISQDLRLPPRTSHSHITSNNLLGSLLTAGSNRIYQALLKMTQGSREQQLTIITTVQLQQQLQCGVGKIS